MKSRLLASVALSVAVMLGATGCSMLSPQGTEVQYAPSDGVSIPDSAGAPLQLRNVFIVANKDGSAGNLIASVVNSTKDPHTLNIQVGLGSTSIDKTLRVPANSVVSLGTADYEPLLLNGIDTMPGATLPVYFQSGDAQGVTSDVPVLDGTLPYYAEFVPAAAPQG